MLSVHKDLSKENTWDMSGPPRLIVVLYGKDLLPLFHEILSFQFGECPKIPKKFKWRKKRAIAVFPGVLMGLNKQSIGAIKMNETSFADEAFRFSSFENKFFMFLTNN